MKQNKAYSGDNQEKPEGFAMLSYLYMSGRSQIIRFVILGVLVVLLVGLGWWAYQMNKNHQPSAINDNSIFEVASTTNEVYFAVSPNGNVGVDNWAPTTALDVRGLIRTYVSDTQTCTYEIEGAIMYNGWNKHFWGCDGSSWHQLDK